MKALFRVSAGRWSATVGRFKPGSFGDDDITLGVVFYCNRVKIICYGFDTSFKELAGSRRRDAGPVVAYAELFEFSLSKSDRDDLRRLVFAADALCRCVQRGGSVEKWGERQGLRPVPKGKAPQARKRPGSVVIQVKDKMFALSPRRRSAAKRRK